MKGQEIAKTKGAKVVLGVTGSIAAYKSAELVRRLRDKGLDVSVVMTAEAQKFITPLTLSTLSGNKVLTDLFCRPSDCWDSNHISLAEWADVVLVAPASVAWRLPPSPALATRFTKKSSKLSSPPRKNSKSAILSTLS